MVLHPQPGDPLNSPSHSDLHRKLAGGTANQVYTKLSSADYDAGWTTSGGGGGGWTAFTTYTPKVGAVDLTDKVMVEDTYDVDTIRRGRYRTNGAAVYAEFVIVPAFSAEPNILIGPDDPVFTVDITGTPGGGTFQLDFRSYSFNLSTNNSVVNTSVLVTFPWNVDAPTMQADIRGADGRLNTLGPTVTGANPNFTVTMPRGSLGTAFCHSNILLNANNLTGGVSPNVIVTQTVFEHVTDDNFYVSLPLPMDGTTLWTFADDSDSGQKFPVRVGNVFIAYDGLYAPSMTGNVIAFPMSTDNPDFQTDYANWMTFVSQTAFPGSDLGDGYPTAWEDFTVFGDSGNVITGALSYFTSTAPSTVAVYDVGKYDVNVYA